MERTEMFDNLIEATKKETTLTSLAELFEVPETTILGYINLLKLGGENISVIKKDHEIIILNQGERYFTNRNDFTLPLDSDGEFKFMLISDTRLGSRFSQPSLLNDAYQKAYNMGIRNVIHGGNISEGLYSTGSDYEDTLFAKDTLQQVSYIIENYPYLEGMKTYFIGGTKEQIHLTKKKIDIGKRISEKREDMIYLGAGNCYINLAKIKILLSNLKLEKNYTESYQIQKVIDSIRSEDKPNIYLCGGLLKLNSFPYRKVRCIAIPSLTATTKEMLARKSNNVVGVWYGKIKVNRLGYLEDINLMSSPYYKTIEDDYIKAKVLTKGGRR